MQKCLHACKHLPCLELNTRFPTYSYLHVLRQRWDVRAHARVEVWEVRAAHRGQGVVLAQGQVWGRDDMQRHACSSQLSE